MIKTKVKLNFPDFEKPFHLYTDASDIQLGATLVQEGRPLGFYTRKLNNAQRSYTVGEKELLGIVEGMKAFNGIIRGQDLTVHTDHLNLLYNKLPCQRMIRWRLLLEEYHPTVVHVAGVDNDAADALSRLDMLEDEADLIEWGEKNKKLEYSPSSRALCLFMSKSNFEDDGLNGDLLMPMTRTEETSFPLDMISMRNAQLNDDNLQSMVNKEIKQNKDASIYTYKEVEGIELIHKANRILVPKTKQQAVLDWYHTVLVHPGEKRMIESIRLVFTWMGLSTQVRKFVKTCGKCQLCKRAGKKKYGHLPAKIAETIRWNRLNVDLWGPKSVRNVNGYTYELHVMTMIDPTKGWFEQQQLYGTPTAYRCQAILDNVWLSRYPRPV